MSAEIPSSPSGSLPFIPTLRHLRRGILVAVGWLVLLVLLCLVVARQGDFLDALLLLRAESRPIPLIGGFILMFGGLGFMGFRWRALIPGHERTSGFVLAATACSGQLLNVALPGPVGEVVASWLLERRYGTPGPLALAASIHARVVGLVLSASLAVIVIVFFPMPVIEGTDGILIGTAIFVGLVAFFLGVVTFRPRILIFWTDLTFARTARSRWRPFARISDIMDRWVRGFALGLSDIGRGIGRPHLEAAGWGTCGILSVVFGDWVVSMALGVPGDPAGLLFAHCVATAGTVVIFSLPVGQVGWDASLIALLVLAAGLPLPNAMALTVIIRAQQTAILVIGALFMAWTLPRTIRGFHGGNPPTFPVVVERDEPGSLSR